MKDFLKRVFVAVMAVTFLAVCIPLNVEAAETRTFHYSYNKIPVTSGAASYSVAKKYSAKADKDNVYYTYNVLQIKVPKNGYLIFTTNDSSKKIYINTKVEKDVYVGKADYSGRLNDVLTGKTKYYRVLPKGTYYLWSDSSNSDLKLKYTFKSVSNPTNYARATASKLNSGVTKKVVFNNGYEYSRWFKITLSAKKKITINLKNLDDATTLNDPYFKVFNSKGTEVATTAVSGKSNQYVTKAAQKKGVYYVRIDYPYYYSKPWYFASRIRNFSWK